MSGLRNLFAWEYGQILVACTMYNEINEEKHLIGLLVVVWLTRGFLAGYWGALQTLVIEPSIFLEGDLA
jgi:hypothetical protein